MLNKAQENARRGKTQQQGDCWWKKKQLFLFVPMEKKARGLLVEDNAACPFCSSGMKQTWRC